MTALTPHPRLTFNRNLAALRRRRRRPTSDSYRTPRPTRRPPTVAGARHPDFTSAASRREHPYAQAILTDDFSKGRSFVLRFF
ncbi:hypothetical protein PCL_02205 [Purpureocillium lilacinum]|uniref:Uncharacterized protein n=1 Tax=Purpureocillium lilacinum TaxID=33203 RepID=A0A2U3E1T3_PURLI|nr:hypothetical protein PCL_02205 [Purpureocillium lilacinum]